MRDPHANKPLVAAGCALDEAELALVLLHGRGSDPSSMQRLAVRLDLEGTAVLMPTAAQQRWYPHGFLEPPEANEPDLGSALSVVTHTVAMCAAAGLDANRVIVGGFSQGACLAGEWAVRNPRRYAGLVLLSGGLIGPLGELPSHSGTLDGTPVILGCSDVDPWIPMQRVQETRAELERMGARVQMQIFEGADHSIRDAEVDAMNSLLNTIRGMS